MLSAGQKQLIKELRKNSRQKLTSLSEKLDVPLSTLHDRLYKLIRDDTIRLVTIPNYYEINRPLHVWIFIKAKDKQITKSYLQAQYQVNTLLAVNNGADYAVEAVFSHFKEYDEFLTECKRYGTIKTHPVIEVVCVETAQLPS